jgi:hypothetical protein
MLALVGFVRWCPCCAHMPCLSFELLKGQYVLPVYLLLCTAS